MRDLLRPSFFRPANRVFLGLHPRVCGLQFGVSARDALIPEFKTYVHITKFYVLLQEFY
jgi:hypothetical protein